MMSPEKQTKQKKKKKKKKKRKKRKDILLILDLYMWNFALSQFNAELDCEIFDSGLDMNHLR